MCDTILRFQGARIGKAVRTNPNSVPSIKKCHTQSASLMLLSVNFNHSIQSLLASYNIRFSPNKFININSIYTKTR